MANGCHDLAKIGEGYGVDLVREINGIKMQTSDLELIIWGAVQKSYGESDKDSANKIYNLQQRLIRYFGHTPPTQRATQIGVEDLNSDETIVKYTQTVVDRKFIDYRRKVSRGVEEIFEQNDEFFLKENIRDKRNWLIRYAALLHIIDRDNRSVRMVTDFVNNVDNLLAIYHNFRVENMAFDKRINETVPISDRSYESILNHAISEINDLDKVNSQDPVIQLARISVQNLLYTLSGKILAYADMYSDPTRSNTHNWFDKKEYRIVRNLIGEHFQKSSASKGIQSPIHDFYADTQVYMFLLDAGKMDYMLI